MLATSTQDLYSFFHLRILQQLVAKDRPRNLPFVTKSDAMISLDLVLNFPEPIFWLGYLSTCLCLTVVTVHLYLERPSPHASRSVPAEDDHEMGASSSEQTDVAIVGGNAMGLMTALFCEQACLTGTRITVFEREIEPKQSVGESGLSTLSRAMQSIGLDLAIQSSLFNLKSGLAFYHADDPSMHIEVTNLDYSFQFDRRTLSLLLQSLCRRRGVQINNGCHAEAIRPSDKAASDSMLHEDNMCRVRVKDRKNAKESIIYARVIIDASGARSQLVSKARFAYFNCNAVWTYYRSPQVLPNELQRFEQPTTKHISFREGWMWIIRLIDWSSTPTHLLQAYIEDIFDRQAQGRPLLSIDAAAEVFGLTYEYQFSVGFVIREDMDEKPSTGSSNEHSFRHWIEKYELVSRTLAPYTRVEGSSVHRRVAPAHYNTTPVRDGLTCVGDSVAFSNPFLSRGLNIGVVGCLTAAYAVAEGLARHSMKFVSDPTPRQIQLLDFMKQIPPMLGEDYRVWHSTFASREAYERVLLPYLMAGVGHLGQYRNAVESSSEVTFNLDEELFAYGLLLPFVKPMFTVASQLMIGYSASDNEGRMRVDAEIKKLSAGFIADLRCTFGKQPYSLFVPGYDDDLNRVGLEAYQTFVDEHSKKIGCFKSFFRCQDCKNWTAELLKHCSKCTLNE
ncbi:hypothetical protein R1sor_023144 [Riccia sorocarpa]|uniref:Uncharacterized protein n=1 Tax=Riccia sorocarpa TaxID=122646 RepID=A0ABD3GLX4_9MARC